MTARTLVAAILLVVPTSLAIAEERITLREDLSPGRTAVVRQEFKAQGDMIIPHGNNKDTSQAFSAEVRLVFEEKMLEGPSDATPRPCKSLRYYTTSSLESVVEKNRVQRELREPVRLMVCELRDGRPFVFSPAAPLTIDEFELVDADATFDSLVIGGLLPPEPVAKGATWKPSDAALCAVLNLARVSENALNATLESFTETSARITIGGHVKGISRGAASTRTIAGAITFDRALSLITQIELSHSEEVSMGPLGHALRAKATYHFRRDANAPIVQLADPRIAKIPTSANTATELLAYAQPDGKYRFYSQRGWYVTLTNPQASVLRLVENGELVSECHILAAPTVASGSHMKPEEFRAQVQQALGRQFQQFLQEGEVPAAKGYWIYRLSAAGSADGDPVIWNYHLVAGPLGQQLVFIFRVPADRVDSFGVRDLALVSTLEFEQPRTATNKP